MGFQLVSKSEIVQTGTIDSPVPTTDHRLVLNLNKQFAQKISPNVRLAVFCFIRSKDGRIEVIGDSVGFNVDATFPYDVSVTFLT